MLIVNRLNKAMEHELRKQLLTAAVFGGYGRLSLPTMPTPSSSDSKEWNATGSFYYDYDKSVEVFLLERNRYEPFISWDGKRVLIFKKVEIGSNFMWLHYFDPGIQTNKIEYDDLETILICQIASKVSGIVDNIENHDRCHTVNIKRHNTANIIETEEEF